VVFDDVLLFMRQHRTTEKSPWLKRQTRWRLPLCSVGEVVGPSRRVTGLDDSAGQPDPSQTSPSHDLSADLMGVARVAASKARNAAQTISEKVRSDIISVSLRLRDNNDQKTYGIRTQRQVTLSCSSERPEP
jgi:hypothetical protein